MFKKILNAIGGFFKLYIVVYGLTMLASIIFMFAFDTGDLSRKFMVNTVIFCFLALAPTLPLFVMTEQFRENHRLLFQFFILLFNEATLMPFGFYINMWANKKSGILMAIIILVINLTTPLITFGKDSLLANKLNDQFKQLNDD